MVSKIGIVRDNRFLEHETGLVHPEQAFRLKAIYKMLDRDFGDALVRIRPWPAAIDELEMVHTPAYIEKLLTTADYDFTYLAPDTPASSRSYLAAWLAVGGCLRALESLMSGECDCVFALIRPPGHHALPDRASGFCIFNNLAIAARQGQKAFGLDRILIVDWDIHHGNGIQQIFYEEREVFYFSSHYIGSFPHTGDLDEAGLGPGLGYTVNIPLPKNLADDDILHCYREVLGPIIRRYRPQIIMVAAGFDGHFRDPLGHLGLTEKGYGGLTRLLLDCGDEVGGPPLLLALEGGYDITALAESVRAVLRVLTSDRGESEPDIPVTPLGRDLAEQAARVHARYGVWLDRPPEHL
ncbi:MAG: histone deacetylase [Proteobacteria bacterium]|nr:histone deacetylase [Pseudomonadota bacterium]